MNLKRALWFPIAIGLIVINAAGAVYALLMSEPMHAFVHGAVLVGSALWARYLRQTAPRKLEDQDEKVELLQSNLSDLERQLNETQQRLDFADQLQATQGNGYTAGTVMRRSAHFAPILVDHRSSKRSHWRWILMGPVWPAHHDRAPRYFTRVRVRIEVAVAAAVRALVRQLWHEAARDAC